MILCRNETRLRHVLAMVLAFVLPACSDVIGSRVEYPDAVKYSNEPLFRSLWAELGACSKLRGNLSGVGFFYVPRTSLPSALHGIRTIGIYFPESNRIFIVESEKSNPAVIRHEMMHALLKNASGHPPLYFGADGLCGYL
jgi:hypothetical protein